MSLFLQRFGLPFGEKALSVVGPIGLGLAVYGLATGALSFHKARLITYLALVFLVLLGMTWHAAEPFSFAVGSNVNSLAQFLLLTGFATLTFAEPVDETAFFDRVTFWFGVIALAGILQFLAQFFGLGLFAFTGLLPDSILYESGYNLQILVGVGEVLKSNGFVLVEPSVFSQLMALALIIEAMGRRRLPYLAVFIAGLLLSFSGTGWIVLGAFVVGSMIGAGWRGLLIAVGVLIALGIVLAVASVAAPDFVESLAGRISEVNRPSTSGHLRFVTPFWVLSDVQAINPLAGLVGLGSGVSERLTLPYEYNVNTPIKVMIDYGAPVLVAYVLLFVIGRKTPVQTTVVLPAVVLFMFTGGYQQFPPMVFIVLLLTAVARLRVSEKTQPLGAARRQAPVPIRPWAASNAR